MIAAIVRNGRELAGDTNQLIIGIAVVAAGAALYFLSALFQSKKPA